MGLQCFGQWLLRSVIDELADIESSMNWSIAEDAEDAEEDKGKVFRTLCSLLSIRWLAAILGSVSHDNLLNPMFQYLRAHRRPPPVLQPLESDLVPSLHEESPRLDRYGTLPFHLAETQKTFPPGALYQRFWNSDN